jgi:hypothetical protein
MGSVEGIVVALARSKTESLSEGTPAVDVLRAAMQGSFGDWMATPASVLLGASCVATIEWLKEHGREPEARSIELKTKAVFSLAKGNLNEVLGFAQELEEEGDALSGMEPIIQIWQEQCAACKPFPRDPETGHEIPSFPKPVR